MATLEVHTERSVFFPGNNIRGTVVVRNPTQQAIPFTRLMVKIKGKEMTHTRSGVDRKSAFLRTHVVLAGTLAKRCEPGKAPELLWLQPGCCWTYPWEYHLPMGLPASMEAFERKNGSNTHEGLEESNPIVAWGLVRYTARAILVGTPEISDPADSAKKARLAVQKAGLTLLSMIPQSQWEHANPISLEYNLQLKNIEKGCCGDKEIDGGAVRLEMMVDRTIVAMDRDRIVVQFNIDNTAGKVAVTNLEITVQAQCHIQNPDDGTDDMIIYTKVAEAKVDCNVGPGKQERAMGKMRILPHTVPSQMGRVVSVTHAAHIELVGVELASGTTVKAGKGRTGNSALSGSSAASFQLHMALAQGVDTFDAAPKADFSEPMYKAPPPGHYDEFAFQPPQPRPSAGGAFQGLQNMASNAAAMITTAAGGNAPPNAQAPAPALLVSESMSMSVLAQQSFAVTSEPTNFEDVMIITCL